MTIKELFEGPVGDYCIARITIKCLFYILYSYFLYLNTLNVCLTQSVEFSPANGSVCGSSAQSVEYSPANGSVSGSSAQSVEFSPANGSVRGSSDLVSSASPRAEL